MEQLIKPYWPAWLVTFIGMSIAWLDIPFISIASIFVVSLVWARMAVLNAKPAVPKPSLQLPSARPTPEAVVTVKESSGTLHLIMGDVDAVIDQEVDVVRTELLQVKDLVAESIDTLSNSFTGLHEQTKEQYELVLSLLANLGGGGDGMCIEKF